jgi:sugar/nucleoside kinase (ribokinase family)
VKRGEHGALLVESAGRFFAPAFPLEEVFDPTGAGDCFAGGVLGYIARSGEVSSPVLRRAIVYGAAMGSFAVAQFGIGGFDGVTRDSLQARVQSFHDLTHVDLAEPIG